MHGAILAFLTLLFLLRVVGQVLVACARVTWLPSMEQWFSGLVPYRILLPVQIVVLLGMIKIPADVWRGEGLFGSPRPRWSRRLIGCSALYADAMIGRYVVTMMLRPEMRWLGGTIPIFFHFVLAGFVFTLGAHYRRGNFRRAKRRTTLIESTHLP
jgi:hypothetical protein